jgi:hypothetical protein
MRIMLFLSMRIMLFLCDFYENSGENSTGSDKWHVGKILTPGENSTGSGKWQVGKILQYVLLCLYN